MKLVQTLALLGLMVLSLMNCKKSDVDSPTPVNTSCKLLNIDHGNGSKRSFDYSSDGTISKMTIQWLDEGKPVVCVYQFTYNANKQLDAASITINGQKPTDITQSSGIGDALKFVWSNNRLLQVTDLLGGKVMLTTTVSYDNQGRIISLKGDADREWGASFEKKFTYESNGNYTYAYVDKDKGYQDFYQETKVDNTIRHGQSLLAAHGLPFDFLNSHTWNAFAVKEVAGYDVDADGEKTLVASMQTSQTVADAHQIMLSQQVNEDGKIRNSQYTLTDCN